MSKKKTSSSFLQPCRFVACSLPDADKNLNGQEELQMDRQTDNIGL